MVQQFPEWLVLGRKIERQVYYHKGQKTALWDKLEVIWQKGGHKKEAPTMLQHGGAGRS